MKWLHALASLALVASTLLALDARAQSENAPARFLYIWMGDADGQDPDFMAVVDVRPESPTYARVIATEPVGMRGTMPHHLEYWMPPPGRLLFGNGHHHEQVFLFDVSEAERPHAVRTLPPVPPLRYPHDMTRLPNGNVLVGYLRSEGPSPLPGDSTLPGGHGGIAEFDPEGRLLRWVSAADSVSEVPIRVYGFAPLPEIDRLVTTSAPMYEDYSAHVVQVWRLSDLRLLRTLPVPPALLPNGEEMRTIYDGALTPTGQMYPFVPRVMPDGSVLLNAYGCGFYRVTGIDTPEPLVENVYTIEVPAEAGLGGAEAGLGACGIPVIAGHYWIMPAGGLHAVIALDVSDPARPREVSRIASDTTFVPHWLAKDPGSNRLILGQEMEHEHRMLMLRIDEETGRLWWDESFRDEDGSLGIGFHRSTWPHGETGEAMGHAALFRQ